jgi:hypothetical protein
VLWWTVVFYVILFSAMAVLLVVAGLTMRSRNRASLRAESDGRPGASRARHRQRKAERAQSRDARRKRG